ncbi:MAG: DUF2905 domain-containing protein [Deltaproteobacteria bacterium]|nr:DUF2905 domain-containing protein [Deltaproteobacteria bacterium]
MAPLGKGLVVLGLVLLAAGALLWALGRVPYLGKLPGDIHIRRGNASFYFPLATCIILSLVVSAILSLMRR